MPDPFQPLADTKIQNFVLRYEEMINEEFKEFTNKIYQIPPNKDESHFFNYDLELIKIQKIGIRGIKGVKLQVDGSYITVRDCSLDLVKLPTLRLIDSVEIKNLLNSMKYHQKEFLVQLFNE